MKRRSLWNFSAKRVCGKSDAGDSSNGGRPVASALYNAQERACAKNWSADREGERNTACTRQGAWVGNQPGRTCCLPGRIFVVSFVCLPHSRSPIPRIITHATGKSGSQCLVMVPEPLSFPSSLLAQWLHFLPPPGPEAFSSSSVHAGATPSSSHLPLVLTQHPRRWLLPLLP